MRRRTCGLRFSVVDAVAIFVCAVATVWLWQISPELALTLPVVLGHFFLFCNVFRIARRPELIWAAVFILNVSWWIVVGPFAWAHVLAIQLPLTAVLILLEMRKPRYHGIFSTRINRRHLDAYLHGEVD